MSRATTSWLQLLPLKCAEEANAAYRASSTSSASNAALQYRNGTGRHSYSQLSIRAKQGLQPLKHSLSPLSASFHTCLTGTLYTNTSPSTLLQLASAAARSSRATRCRATSPACMWPDCSGYTASTGGQLGIMFREVSSICCQLLLVAVHQPLCRDANGLVPTQHHHGVQQGATHQRH